MSRAWCVFADEAAREAELDACCAAAWRSGTRIAVVASNRALISNLSAAENIVLPSAWRLRAPRLAAPVADWLAGTFGEALPSLLRQLPDALTPQQRRSISFARALQLQAQQVLLIDDTPHAEHWLGDAIDSLRAQLPAAHAMVFSERHPIDATRWRIDEPLRPAA